MEYWQLVISIGTVGLAALASYWTVKAGRRKLDAEADALVVDAALEIVQERNAEIAQVKAEVAEVRDEVAALRRWAEVLVDQVRELGGIPVPFELHQRKEPRGG